MCDNYRFDRYEAQVQTGYLLRDGKRVRIEELPFRMLVVLLETPGQVVSREQLRERLWGERAFGEFDNSLHVAATKLREALGDNASDPRYIQTVRRRGYQFIGQVMEPEALPELAAESVAALPPVVPVMSPSSPSRWPLWTGVAAAVLLVVVGFWFWRSRQPLAASGERIVLGTFANNTGEEAYSHILALAFRLKLAESPYLRLVADRQFRRELKNPASTDPTDELRACRAANGQILLLGSLSSLDPSGYQVELSAWRCDGGSQLATVRAKADDRNGVLPALDAATRQMRRKLGESEASLTRFNVPLTQATTASLAALNAFTQGEEKRAAGQESAAITDYRLAGDLDPQFALTFARLGTIYANSGEYALSRRYYRRAFDLRERTTDRERLYIAAHYYSSATGEINRAIDAYELWHSVYPHDMTAANNLADEYLAVGKPEPALQLARTAIADDPSSVLPYATLSLALLRSGNIAELTSLCRDSARNATDILPFHNACYLRAFLAGDTAAMQHELDQVRGNPAESELLDEAAWVAMYQGKVAAGREMFRQAVANAEANHLSDFAAEITLDEANLESDLGYAAHASELAHQALKRSENSADVAAYGALALAQVGDLAGYAAESAKLRQLAPEDTILNTVILASADAQAAFHRGDSAAALLALERARPLDLCNAAELAPAYYRGLAYLAAKRPQDAVKEFTAVVAHRALSPDSPYVPLSLMQLGRAGDKAAAVEAAAIWKDADRDFVPKLQWSR